LHNSVPLDQLVKAGYIITKINYFYTVSLKAESDVKSTIVR